MCLRFSDWPISIHNWVYIFPSCFFGTYSDVLCSEECQTKRLLVCCKMFAFFKAIFKFSFYMKITVFSLFPIYFSDNCIVSMHEVDENVVIESGYKTANTV